MIRWAEGLKEVQKADVVDEFRVAFESISQWKLLLPY